jgi:uncharacterized membrane protein YhaH (DUF805 family)
MADKQQNDNLSLFGYFVKCLKNYANFKGRARIKEFWGFVLFAIIIDVAWTIVSVLIDTSLHGEETSFSKNLMRLFWLAMFLPWIAVFVRRLHDTGRSGWRAPALVAIIAAGVLQSEIPHLKNEFLDILMGVLGLASFSLILFYSSIGSDSGENKYGQGTKIHADSQEDQARDDQTREDKYTIAFYVVFAVAFLFVRQCIK